MRTIKIRASLVEAAEEEIRSTAAELRNSSTVNGLWSDGETEREAKQQHDDLIDLADRLASALAG